MKLFLEFVEKRPAIKTGATRLARFFGFQRALDAFYGNAKRRFLASPSGTIGFPPTDEALLWLRARKLRAVLDSRGRDAR